MAALTLMSLAVLMLVISVFGSTTMADAAVKHRINRASEAAIRDYWTPERMAGATDMGRTVGSRGSAKAAGVASSGVRSRKSATAPGVRHLPARNPHPAIGRLFFRSDGTTKSCSGTVIDTPSKRLVLTAAHCLRVRGQWSTQVFFVPNFFQDKRSYGSWVGETSWVTKPWVRHHSRSRARRDTRRWVKPQAGSMSNFDIGVVVTRRSPRGKRIGDVAGTIPYRAFPSRRGRVNIYGYPVIGYWGREPRVCAGRRIVAGSLRSFRLPGPVGTAARCTLAGGSSGGPWLSSSRGPNGGIRWILKGLTRMSYRGVMTSPYLGRHFRNLIRNAEYR